VRLAGGKSRGKGKSVVVATVAVVSIGRRSVRRRSPTVASPPATNKPQTQGWSGPLKAAVTSGSLCAVGDVLAQSIAGWYASSPSDKGEAAATAAGVTKKGKGASSSSSSAAASSSQPKAYDACRTLRMAGFGLLFYGPYQYYWYSLLEHLMPARTVPNFVSKVAANQLLLAPVTLTVAFAWHLAFSKAAAANTSTATAKTAPAPSKKAAKSSAKAAGGTPEGWLAPSGPPPLPAGGGLAARLQPLPDKLRADFVPALLTGWKFWVPAASVNFCAVPLRHQVLYMSCCGVLWTAYLSHVSGTKIGGVAERA
jgi:protein Mpv17